MRAYFLFERRVFDYQVAFMISLINRLNFDFRLQIVMLNNINDSYYMLKFFEHC